MLHEKGFLGKFFESLGIGEHGSEMCFGGLVAGDGVVLRAMRNCCADSARNGKDPFCSGRRWSIKLLYTGTCILPDKLRGIVICGSILGSGAHAAQVYGPGNVFSVLTKLPYCTDAYHSKFLRSLCRAHE